MQTEAQKHSILIVEDEPGPRDALAIILRPFFTLYTADNAHAAMRILKKERIDLVTLDLKLPDRQGMDLLQDIKLEREDVEVVIITGYGSLKSAMDGIRYGAAVYLLKPFNVAELIALIQQTLEKKDRLDHLRHFLKSPGDKWGTETDAGTTWKLLQRDYRSLGQTKWGPDQRFASYEELAPLLSDLMQAKDRDLFYHASRVSDYSDLLGKRLNLGEAERNALAFGAFLHDIGKVPAEDRLLHKTGKLDAREQETSKHHPEIGARMIHPLNLPAEVSQIISYHHEWYDGSGYPDGLQGQGIPLFARIVCLTQEFDHLMTDHHTSPPLPLEEAVAEVRRQAGTRFDPTLAELFTRVVLETKASLPSLGTPSRRTTTPDH
jgi:putative two-component system response regulator